MDVKTLCLGILTFGDATGYDIKKYFEQALSHFFLAGYGSIYPALAELAAAGLVECQEIPGDGRPDKKLYRLTGAGREAFVAALAHTEPRHKVRSEFLVLLYFSHMLPRERLGEVLDRHLAEIDRLLELIEHTKSEQGACTTDGIEFTCGLGRTLLEARRKYIRQNRHRIEGELPRAAGSRG